MERVLNSSALLRKGIRRVIKVSVLYPNQTGTKFDMKYYLEHHIPLIQRLVGPALKGVSVEQGLSGEEPGTQAPYIALGHFLFDSVEVFQGSFVPHAEEFVADVPKYTNSLPMIQISEVKL